MKIIVALLIFSIIVIFHELGHFLLAKKNGICVTEFSLGMGPRIFSFKGKETRYSVKLFPIGGSCMMLGEDEDCDNPRAFNKKGVWARISVIAAGPIFNFILAFILAMFVVGMAGIDEAYVTTVMDGYPAAEAGLQKGDLITEINGKNVDIARDIEVYFQFHPLVSDTAIEVTYERDGKEYQTKLTPQMYEKFMLGFGYTADTNPAKLSTVTEGKSLDKVGIKPGDVIVKVNDTKIPSGEALNSYFNEHPITAEPVTIVYERDGKEATVTATPESVSKAYTLGFAYNQYREGKVTNPLTIAKYSYTEVKFWIKTTVASLGQMVTGKVSMDDIAGPVGIVNIIGDSYEAAAQVSVLAVFLQLAYLSILLSANLGVMNLLPIPALDGGRLVFLLIEAIRGKPINPEKEGLVHTIGFIALMVFMVFVVFHDITSIFF